MNGNNRMRFIYFLVFCSFPFFWLNCFLKDNTAKNKAELQKLASLFCKAENLKEKRFKLAAEFNTFGDSQNSLQDNYFSGERKDSLMEIMNDLVQETKVIADSILYVQDKIYKDLDITERKKMDSLFLHEVSILCPNLHAEQ